MTLALSPRAGALLHLLFEASAYAVGFWLYRRARRDDDPIAAEARWSLLVAVVLGAALGSKLLHHLAQPSLLGATLREPLALLGGKTIVGGLLGGWIAVELAKRRLGIRRRTGDVYAVPLAVGIAVGRLGCFLAGPADGTAGLPTDLAWGVAVGDGVARHPVALLEAAFLFALAAALAGWTPRVEGDRFRAFLAAYLGFRVGVDFLKPIEPVAGLGVLQWASLAGLLAVGLAAAKDRRPLYLGDPAHS